MKTRNRSPARFGIVVSRFNETLTQHLLRGALETFKRHGIGHSAVDTVWVPGAFEIPVATEALARSCRYQGLVVLGAVVRGMTHHYDAICREVSHGVAETARTSGVPIGFGVIMADRWADARDRAAPPRGHQPRTRKGGDRRSNLGVEAAEAALEMARVLHTVPCAAAAKPANTH